MTRTKTSQRRGKHSVHRWIRRAFVLWAVVSTLWLANSYRTRGVNDRTLRSSPTLSVFEDSQTLQFLPTTKGNTGLVFLCGSGVAAHAYAPLLRPLAEAGYLVCIVKLPYRFAPFESHKQTTIDRVRSTLQTHQPVSHWVLAGHSLGGALACRAALADPQAYAALVLIGTTHPKADDLSSLPIRVFKVYATNDGIAPPDRTLANKRLLPATTRWVRIKGGNHSQFGNYGHQLLDDTATIPRDTQQAFTRSALLKALSEAAR